MTREEAIDNIKNLKRYMKTSDKQNRHKFLDEIYIALDMAIEALGTIDGLCENLAWYINERNRLLQEQRPHGEWIKHVDDLFPEESTEECSVCHEEQRITGNDDNYCPNCGASMRKREGDEK